MVLEYVNGGELFDKIVRIIDPVTVNLDLRSPSFEFDHRRSMGTQGIQGKAFGGSREEALPAADRCCQLLP